MIRSPYKNREPYHETGKNFATRVLFLENGAIFFDGTFDDLTAAADPRIRQFLKKIYPFSQRWYNPAAYRIKMLSDKN
ncbi:MAG: hypothetical protein LC657_17400, partial [Desulfobacteraceae bacterium]|nr:hypothetical protein [Desulfobacteraceae bacterium]